jgi:hypothetical protein
MSANDVTRIFHVLEWWVAMYKLPRRRAERPHIYLERIVQAAVGESQEREKENA